LTGGAAAGAGADCPTVHAAKINAADASRLMIADVFMLVAFMVFARLATA
jgi:hypothetical protein